MASLPLWTGIPEILRARGWPRRPQRKQELDRVSRCLPTDWTELWSLTCTWSSVPKWSWLETSRKGEEAELEPAPVERRSVSPRVVE